MLNTRPQGSGGGWLQSGFPRQCPMSWAAMGSHPPPGTPVARALSRKWSRVFDHEVHDYFSCLLMMSLCACDLKAQGSIQAVAVPNNGVNRIGGTKGRLTGSVSQTTKHKNWKPQPFALHCPPLLVYRRRCLFLGWMKGSDTDITVVFPILSLTLSHTTTLTRLFLQQCSLFARPRLFLLRFPALFPSLLCFSLLFCAFPSSFSSSPSIVSSRQQLFPRPSSLSSSFPPSDCLLPPSPSADCPLPTLPFSHSPLPASPSFHCPLPPSSCCDCTLSPSPCSDLHSLHNRALTVLSLHYPAPSPPSSQCQFSWSCSSHLPLLVPGGSLKNWGIVFLCSQADHVFLQTDGHHT